MIVSDIITKDFFIKTIYGSLIYEEQNELNKNIIINLYNVVKNKNILITNILYEDIIFIDDYEYKIKYFGRNDKRNEEICFILNKMKHIKQPSMNII